MSKQRKTAFHTGSAFYKCILMYWQFVVYCILGPARNWLASLTSLQTEWYSAVLIQTEWYSAVLIQTEWYSAVLLTPENCYCIVLLDVNV